MTAPTCVVCTKPMPDTAYGCAGCSAKGGRDLAQIADMVGAARDVAQRQTSRGGGGSGKPGSSLPIDLGATARLDAVERELGTWVRHVAETRGIHPPHLPHGFDTIPHAARFLVGQLEWLRHRAEVDEALRDFAACARVVRSVAEKRRPGRYAGPCSRVDGDGKVCGEDVEARPGSEVGACRACGSEYDVDEQQGWMRAEIEDQLARPVEISGMLGYLGLTVPYRRIMKYVEKGHLVEHGFDGQQRALYRVGDVLEIIARNETPRRAGQSSRGDGQPVERLTSGA